MHPLALFAEPPANILQDAEVEIIIVRVVQYRHLQNYSILVAVTIHLPRYPALDALSIRPDPFRMDSEHAIVKSLRGSEGVYWLDLIAEEACETVDDAAVESVSAGSAQCFVDVVFLEKLRLH